MIYRGSSRVNNKQSDSFSDNTLVFDHYGYISIPNKIILACHICLGLQNQQAQSLHNPWTKKGDSWTKCRSLSLLDQSAEETAKTTL